MRFISLFLLCASALASRAQSITEHIYGRQGSAEDLVHQLVETPDGGFLIAGQTTSNSAGQYGAFIQKTNAAGQQQWWRTYGGPANDVAASVAATPDGGYVFGGYTESEGQGRADGFVKKAGPDGAVEWTALFGSSGWDEVVRVQPISGGRYAVCGTAVYDQETNGQDVFWAILGPTGSILAQEVIESPYLDRPLEIAESSDGGILLLYSNPVVVCAKYTPGGQLQWKREFQFSTSTTCHLATGANGQVYLAGRDLSSTAFVVNLWCFDASGNLQWEFSPGLQASPLFVRLQANAAGQVRLAFEQTRLNPGQFPPKVKSWILNNQGNLLQADSVTLPLAGQLRDIRFSGAGDLIVLCRQYTQQNEQSDFSLTAFQYTNPGYTLSWSNSFGETAPNESDYFLNSCRSTRNTFFSASVRYIPANASFGVWVLQTDTNGKIISETDLPLGVKYLANPMKPTPDGGCVLLVANYDTLQLAKIAPTGQLEWTRTLALPFSVSYNDLAVMPDGGYALFTPSYNLQSGIKPAVHYLSPEGRLLSTRYLEVSLENRFLEKMIPLKNGGFALQGWIYRPEDQRYDLWMVFANKDGGIAWETISVVDYYINTSFTDGQALLCSDGGFLLAGSFGYQAAPNQNRAGVAMLRLNAYGQVQWDHELIDLSGEADVYPMSIEEAPCQGFVLAARTDPRYPNLPNRYRLEDRLRLLQWIDYSGHVRAFFDMKTYPGPNAADFSFIPCYTYYEWGGKENPNFWDVYFWRVQFPDDGTMQVAEEQVHIAPNPSTDVMCMSYTSDYTGPIEVQVFDAAGRLVDRLSDTKTEQTWMKRYDRPFATGHYFIRLNAGGHRASGHWVKQ